MPIGLAERILADLGPAATLPVNIEGIIQNYGISLVRSLMPLRFYGIYITGSTTKQPIIIVNEKLGEKRERFTLAHELYHHLTTNPNNGSNSVAFHATLGPSQRRANRFAAELLVPRKAICHLHRLGKTVKEMSDIFGVSEAAIEIRLQEVHCYCNK